MYLEEIKVVKEYPLILLLRLSDGVSEGRWDAAENFAELFAEVRIQCPNIQFQFIPFTNKTGGNCTAGTARRAIG